jgi:hypothetical protein
MIIHDCIQGGDDWHEIRRGKITASHFKDVMAKGSGATRTKYMRRLCMQRRQSIVQPAFKGTASMQWGTDHEDEAIARYELKKDCQVERVGFVEISDWIGSSPDGLVGKLGVIETKCPDSSTHFDYLIKNQKDPTWYDPTHKFQMQGNMWCLDRKWCDWISYDPRFDAWEDQIIIVRVHRDEELIDELRTECNKFRMQAEEILSKFPKLINF